METVRVTRGKHTWFTKHQDGRITMETDWEALAKEIDTAIKNLNIVPARKSRTHKRGKTIKINHGR